MKKLMLGLIVSIVASVGCAQESGFFASIGGGFAQMKVDSIAFYNPLASIPGQPLGEALPVLQRGETVGLTRFTLGYTIDQNWDVRMSYAKYANGEVRMAVPVYPGIYFVTAPDAYPRHVLVYQASAFAILPTYSYAVSDQLRVRAGLGVNYGMTRQHIEDSRRGTLNGTIQDNRYAKRTSTSLSSLLSFGTEYKITKQLSAGVEINYSRLNANTPTIPWANRSKSRVNIDPLGGEFALTWRW